MEKITVKKRKAVNVRGLTVTLLDNPKNVVIDQGADPLSAP